MPTKTLNAKQLATVLAVSRHTIYVWCRDGRIPFLRAGRAGHIRFDPGEVMQAIRGHAPLSAA
jgi:excisionase family DNA binding protein